MVRDVFISSLDALLVVAKWWKKVLDFFLFSFEPISRFKCKYFYIGTHQKTNI